METLLNAWNFYVDLYYNDHVFVKYAIYVPLVSWVSFLVIGIPFTILPFLDKYFPSIHRLYIQKKRPEIESWILPGLFWATFNHFCLLLFMTITYPYFEAPVKYLMDWSDDFYDFSAEPWRLPMVILQLYGCIYLEDFTFYHVHRWLHQNKFLYNHIHKWHHQMTQCVAIAGLYMHPIEFLINGSQTFLGPTLLMCHYKTALIWVVFRMWEASEEHAGIDLPHWLHWPHWIFPFYEGVSYHEFHHSKCIGNYGSLTPIWDYLYGTMSPGFLKAIERQDRYEGKPDAPIDNVIDFTTLRRSIRTEKSVYSQLQQLGEKQEELTKLKTL